MPIIGWIRDLFGIGKDAIETEKAMLEVTKLREEEVERNFVTPATLDDVKKYDPKYQALMKRIKEEEGGFGGTKFLRYTLRFALIHYPKWQVVLFVVLWVVFSILIATLIMNLVSRL